jgi:hypothetical protein
MLGGDNVVGRLPTETPRDVVQFGGKMRSGIRSDAPTQRGFQQERIGCRGEDRQAWKLKLQLAIDLNDWLSAVFIRCAHYLSRGHFQALTFLIAAVD